MAFPSSPTDGQIYTSSSGTSWEYSASDNAWKKLFSEDGGRVLLFHEENFTSSSTWTVDHKLNTLNVLVEVYDDSDNKIIPENIEITSSSQVVVTFSTATTGKVVVGGYTTQYIEASYPNILINTNFKDPINQYGTDLATGVTMVNGEYQLDRWETAVGITAATLSNTSNGIKVNADTVGGTNYARLEQRIENYTDYEGMSLKLSAKVRANLRNSDQNVLQLTDGTTLAYTQSSGNEVWEILEVSISSVDTSTGYLIARIGGINSGTFDANGQYIEIEWIKLEVGSERTLWVPPEPQQELARCMRYYWRIAGEAYAALGSGINATTTTTRIMLQLPVPMASEPTLENGLTLDGTSASEVVIYSGGVADYPTGVSLYSNVQEGADGVTGVTLVFSGISVTQYEGAFAQFDNKATGSYIAFEAEL